MHSTNSLSPELAARLTQELDPKWLGAAASKLLAASIGDIVVLFSRSSVHKHYTLADIDWMVLPPAAAGQFYVAEAADAARGFRAPIAVVTWALVSEETDRRFEQHSGGALRLRPDEWTGGSIGWLIDAVGNPAGVKASLQWLAEGPFKERSLKLIVRESDGMARITTLKALMEPRATTPEAAT